MAERAQVTLLQHPLNRLEDERNFPAAAERLFIGDLIRVFGFANPGNRQLSSFNAADVLGILLGTDQLILATSDELEQVIQKLGSVGGTNVVVQTQLTEIAAKKNP